MSRPRTKIAILAGTLALAGLLPASVSAGSGLAPTGQQQAGKSVELETVVRYITKGKIKPQRKVRFVAVCSVACNVTVDMTLVVPGPNLSDEPLSATFAAGEVWEGFIDLGSKSNVGFLKANKKKSKFRTSIQAVDPATGNTDTDQRVFRFK
jgi:hypothetical protein